MVKTPHRGFRTNDRQVREDFYTELRNITPRICQSLDRAATNQHHETDMLNFLALPDHTSTADLLIAHVYELENHDQNGKISFDCTSRRLFA